MRIYWNLFKERNLILVLYKISTFFLCMCVNIYTYTHTESFSDFHQLLGDLHLLTVSLQILIADLNRGREESKYYLPENRVVVLF